MKNRNVSNGKALAVCVARQCLAQYVSYWCEFSRLGFL